MPFVKRDKMNMKTGKWEPVNYEEKKKKKFFNKNPVYNSFKPQIKEYKQKQKMERMENKIKALNKRDQYLKKKTFIRNKQRTIRKRQMEPYTKAGTKIIKGTKKLETWGNSFNKPRSRTKTKRSSGKGKTVLMIDASGRIIGTKTIRSKKSTPRRTQPRETNSGINTDYFFGSSSSGKKKNNKKNSFDNIGGWI